MSIVDIRIEGLDKLTVDIERLRNDASFKWPKEIMDTASEMMKDAIANEAVGSLKDKVIVEITHDTRRVIVDSPYAIYVNDGTGPSFGRYVPAIGRRLVNPPRGIHPGVPATHFFDRGVGFATTSILGYVHRKLNEYIMEI